MQNASLNPNDDQLRRALREADIAPALPPRFQDEVWRRIEKQTGAVAAKMDWLDRLASYVIRPQFVTAGLSLVLMAGIFLGVTQVEKSASEDSRARYLAKVDPWQSHR